MNRSFLQTCASARSWPNRQSMHRRAVAASSLILLALLLAACGYGQPSPPSADTPEPPPQGQVEVVMQGSQFQPAEVTIEAGTTVVWTNQDALPHTVTAGSRGNPSGLFDEDVGAGGDFSFTFEEPGTYEYYCSIHPGMDGTVVVE
jgi:plastocyanin